MNHRHHMMIDQIVLGNSFLDVHQWLDESPIVANDEVLPYSHWVPRHNKLAITEQYGKDTPEYFSAILHVVCDWLYHFDSFLIPETSEETETHLIALGKL